MWNASFVGWEIADCHVEEQQNGETKSGVV